MSEPSRLVSDQPIDEIAVAGVFRSDLGAVGELAESIAKLGLLSPVVVTEDRLLVSGGRRLAAVRALGWTTVPAWVAPKVSDRLSRVLAARDTDALHKRLTPVEQAELYAELEQLYAAEAGRRRQAGGPAGGPPDSPAAAAGGEAPARPPGRRAARAEAARAGTGAGSHPRLEQINEL
jgi:ParB family chromosome partitioning protein